MDTLWLYLEPYTFISEDSEYFFFYNANIQKGISFQKNESITPLVKKLQEPDMLYSIKFNVKELENEYIYNFIEAIQASRCGDIIEGDLSKPLVMPPLLNLQRSVERLKQHNLPVGEKILSYLHEVVIYVNGECSLNCGRCKNEFKQHLCCTMSENTLDFTLLKNFLSTISYTGASVTILGGDVFKYAELSDLFNILKGMNSVPTLITHWRNVPDNLEILNLLSHGLFKIKIIINDEYQVDLVVALAKKIKQSNIEQSWEISIASLSEYEKAEALNQQLTELNIDVVIKPFYDGNNNVFFEENVFIDIDDIDDFKLDRQGIFVLQELNTNDFGKIIILSDGKVYANINNEPIGVINDSIEEMLCKELEHGKSWRRTRYNTEPCCQCRFKLLCPSPSNYEMVIGKNNLCNVVKNEGY